MRHFARFAVGLIAGLMITGCSLFQSSAVTPPPPDPGVFNSAPSDGSGAGPTSAPAAGSVSGSVLFVNAGQVWKIGLDGSGQAPVVNPGSGAVIRDLTVSPDGHYAAFTVNGTTLTIYDLLQNQSSPVDVNGTGTISQLVWSPSNNALYFHRAATDEGGNASRSQIVRVPLPPGTVADRVTDRDLVNEGGIIPLYGVGDGLIFGKIFSLTDQTGGGYLLVNPDGTNSPAGDGFGFWDLLNGKLLGYRTEQFSGAQRSAPIALWTGDLASGQVANPQQISPADDPAAFMMARFSPDGSRVFAVKSVQDASGNWFDTLVSIPPLLNGAVVESFQSDPAAPVVSFSIVDATHLVVQRLRNGQPELWFVSVDGTSDRLLTSGEQPAVIGGR